MVSQNFTKQFGMYLGSEKCFRLIWNALDSIMKLFWIFTLEIIGSKINMWVEYSTFDTLVVCENESGTNWKPVFNWICSLTLKIYPNFFDLRHLGRDGPSVLFHSSDWFFFAKSGHKFNLIGLRYIPYVALAVT